MNAISRVVMRAFLALTILFLRWEISHWNYGMDQRCEAERKVVDAEQAIRQIKLMILRMEYNNI